MEKIKFIKDQKNDRLIGVITETIESCLISERTTKIKRITFCQGLCDIEYAEQFIWEIFNDETDGEKLLKTCEYLRENMGIENIVSCAKFACEIYVIIELK